MVSTDVVKEVLARYEAGETIREVCKDYGVSHVTLYKRIIEDQEEYWKSLQVATSLARKEEAERELDTAPDMVTVARCTQRLKAAQWDLERVCRRIYGQEPAAVLGAGVINITIGINRGDAAVLPPIEGESKQEPEK
jgi:transposase-like protein